MKKRKQGAKLIGRCLKILAAGLFLLIFVGAGKAVFGAKWDGVSRFTLVADADPLVLFSIEPQNRQAILVLIPSNIMLDVPYGYSTYPAGAVYRLGKLDGKRGGGLLLSKSIENTAGVMVDGYLAQKSGSRFAFPTDKDRLYKFKKDYFSLLSLLKSVMSFQFVPAHLDTNLSYLDLFRLANAIRNIRSDQITVINLADTSASQDERLPDQTIVKRLDRDVLDAVLYPQFLDQKIRSQNVSVEIVNASGGQKVASQFAKVLRNIGANTVNTRTSVNDEKSGCIISVAQTSLESKAIVLKLQKSYNCSIDKVRDTGIADIRVTLGEGFIQ